MNKKDIRDVARNVGLSLITKNITVSPLKLQKVLYYIQAWHMVFFNRENTFFDDIPEAWVNGPVYPVIFHQYKNIVSDMCQHLSAEDFGADGDILNTFKEVSQSLNMIKEEEELVESVIVLYGVKSQNELIFLTHAEKPWAEKREGLAPYEKSNNPISLDTMHSYYKERHDRNRKRL